MASTLRAQGLDRLAADLHRIRVNTTQAAPAFKDIAEIIAASQRRQFYTEGSHYDTPWAPLDPATVAAKGHGRILEDTGRLRRAVAPTTGAGFPVLRVSRTRVEVGVDSTVPYASHVHHGGRHTPARPLFGPLPADVQGQVADALHRHMMGGTTHARR